MEAQKSDGINLNERSNHLILCCQHHKCVKESDEQFLVAHLSTFRFLLIVQMNVMNESL